MSRDSTTVITGAPSHRYGYRGGDAARDRAADGTAEAEADGEAPGKLAGRAACSSASAAAAGAAAGAPGLARWAGPVVDMLGLLVLEAGDEGGERDDRGQGG